MFDRTGLNNHDRRAQTLAREMIRFRRSSDPSFDACMLSMESTNEAHPDAKGTAILIYLIEEGAIAVAADILKEADREASA